MRWKKAEGFLLIACVVFSFFAVAYRVSIVCGPGDVRAINVYSVDIAGQPSWWVGDTAAVRDGIASATNDADTRTKVKLAGETINYEVVTNFERFEELVDDPPERAVFVNAHGEVVPMSGAYFGPYVRIERPSDGATVNGTETFRHVIVEATVMVVNGTSLDGSPYVTWGPVGNVGTWRYYLTLMDPVTCRYYVPIQLYWTGDYEIRVTANTIHGLCTCASVQIHYLGETPSPTPPSGGRGCGHRFPIPLCPYVHAWNGLSFSEDNNILFEPGNSTVDYYRLEKPLIADADGNYSLRLDESGGKIDYFDCVGLLAVDHECDVNVGVGPDGTVLTYGVPDSPSSALFGDYNLKWWLGKADDRAYAFPDGWWADIRFDGANVSLGAKLVLRLRSDSECTIGVQRFSEGGGCETVASIKSRVCWSTWVLNVSSWLPDFAGECRLRLFFDGNCTVDFVGLDTTSEANVMVCEGELVSVDDSSGVKATFGDLQDEDGVCAVLRHGYTFDMRFRLPELNGSGLKRDFIFAAKGYYSDEETGVGMLGDGGGVGDMVIAWKDWFEKLENCTRTMGWAWANVAGYSFHYFGNSAYWDVMGQDYDQWKQDDLRQPRGDGLKQFLNRDVGCNCSCDGHIADLGFDYTARNGFWDTYPGFDCHRNVGASRPINNAVLPWNMFFYKDRLIDVWATATIAMNKTELGVACLPGVFVHNGFSKDPDMDGAPNTFNDDWLKGYVTTALAMEEARTFITLPSIRQRESPVVGHQNHTACFGVTTRAADRGELYDTEVQDYYRYVRLMFTIVAYFPSAGTTISPFYYDYFLSHVDIDLLGVSDVRYKIREDECGLDLGSDTQFMDDWHWYAVSTVAGFVPYVGVVAGPVLSALPLLVEHFQPTWKSDAGPQDHAWANGTWIDPNQDYRGTIDFFVEVRFYKGDGGAKTYTFTGVMASWEGLKITLGPVIIATLWREYSLQYTKQLAFSADWNI